MSRGGQKGNKNASKGRKWEEALRTALARSGGSIDLGLAPIADKVVAAAKNGDFEAIHEIACRLDGRPTEHVQIDQDVNVNVGSSDSLAPTLSKAVELRTKSTVQ